MSTKNRRVKWHSTPPSPQIINLPRRRHYTRRKRNKQVATEVIETYNYKGKLESLFGVEAAGAETAEERWRIQAEVLRAECDLLKKERKNVMKKLDKDRVRIKRTLKSALKSVDSGRKKLCEGRNMEVVLEEGMKELSEKLEELQSSYSGEVNRDCSTLTYKSQNKSNNSSKGMLDQMEKDYRSIANSSVASSASTSNRIDLNDHLSFSNRFYDQAKEPLMSQAGNKCSGRCKVLMKKMAEQVRADTEQWSQMQVMLGQLRQEMEELQTSKDFWETQALVSNQEIQSLMLEVDEWREKAIVYEMQATTLQTEVSLVKGEVEKLKNDRVKEIGSTPKKTIISLSKQIERETKNGLSCRMLGPCDAIVSNRHEKIELSKKDSPPLSLAKQLAKEKRIMISRTKENPLNNNESLSDERRKPCNLVGYPFKDIKNSSSSSMGMVRQHSIAIGPLHCREN